MCDMPDLFLNTGRTGFATSNPEANANQVSNSSQQPLPQVGQGVQVQPDSVNNRNNSSTISPITIPIQLQPQIASNPGLQLNTSVNNAPSPQAYENSTNSSVVDFNKIYSSYQNSFGNNQSEGGSYGSGVKKSSIGTTIVTPTITKLNSVQGQYQSAYADTINGIISEMLGQMNSGFQYDPSSDGALRVATEYAANSTLQSLAGSGVLNSSATAERVARIVSELIPQYEEKAHGRWIEYLGQLANTAQVVMTYDSQQFEYWKDSKDREFKEKEFEYQRQQDALTNAWKRVDELGFVDNEASSVLGVKVGTLSGSAREAKEQREFELAKMREQAQIEYENNVTLYKLRSELDLEQNKKLASYQNSLSKSQKEYEYELAKKYGTSSNSSKSSSNGLSTYKDIINNRFANYDEDSKKYIVSDKNEVLHFIDKELNANRMSDDEAAMLISYYGLEMSSLTGDVVKKAKSVANKFGQDFNYAMNSVLRR